MAKDNIIQHFADHGVINTMNPDAKKALFGKYQGFFSSKEIELPTDWPEDDAEVLARIKEVLINLHTENEDAAALGDLLNDVSKINEYAEDVQKELDELKERYQSGLAELPILQDSLLSSIVALCLLSSAREDVSLLVTRLSLREKRNYRDYPWGGGSRRNAGLSEAELDARTAFRCRTHQEIVAAKSDAEKAINSCFKTKQLGTICRVEVYPQTEDGQIWAIVEHGGPKLTIETFDEGGKAGKTKILPLMRDSVVLDAMHKVLRIHASTTWKEQLYVQVFSSLFMGKCDCFHDGSMYTFDPIADKGLGKAFARANWAELRSVEVVRVETVMMHFGQRIYQTLRSTKDVADIWNEKKEMYGQIVSVSLDLKISGAKRPVRVNIRETRGLSVSINKYTAPVRRWLQHLGFEVGYTESGYAPCTDENALAAEDDDAVFWEQVVAIWNAEKISLSTLHRRFSPRVVEFVTPFMVFPCKPEYDDVWYSETGRCWNVAEIDYDFYAYDKEEQSQPTKDKKIPSEQIELRYLDKPSFIKMLAKFLFKRDFTPKEDSKHGLYELGMYYPLNVRIFLYVGQLAGNQGFTPVRKKFRADNGSIGFITFTREAPEPYRDDVNADIIQSDPIWKFASFNNGNLVAPNKLEQYWHRPNEEETGLEVRYWNRAFPQSPSFHHIEMKLGQREVWVQYGEEEQTFTIERLPLFYNKVVGQTNVNGVWKNLAKTITFAEGHPQGFTLKELQEIVPESSLRELSKELSSFFGINDNFYEKIPADANRQRNARYRLAFRRITLAD